MARLDLKTSATVTHFLGGILEEVPLEMSGTGVVSLIVKEDIDVRPKIGQSLGELSERPSIQGP